MKILASLILSLALLASCSSDNDNRDSDETAVSSEFAVNFVKTSFAEARDRAQQADKLLLMDVYADWCGPCKRLDKVVFSDPEAGEFINSRFVSLKVDGEKGQGPELMKEFAVQAYPTIILFDQDGQEIDRIVGFGGDKEEFLQTIRDYLDGKNTLRDMLEQAKQRPEDVQLHYDIATKYVYRGESEKAIPHYRNVLTLDPQNEAGLLDESHYQVAIHQLYAEENPQAVKDFIDAASSEDYMLRAYSSLARYFNRKDQTEKIIETYEAAVEKLPDNPGMLNTYAWFIFKNKLEEKYDRGITLAKKAVELNPEADAIWDTLAQLHYANGNVEAAIEAIKKAVELNPEQESYQKLLEEYQAGRRAA